MKKKILIAVISVFSIAVILLVACVAWDEYINKYKLTDTGTETSPDGEYTVAFQMVGQPVWPFGPTSVKITVAQTKSGEKIKVIDTKIQDDGATLHKNNWEVVWKEDAVEIILKGSEQQDAVHTVLLPQR